MFHFHSGMLAFNSSFSVLFHMSNLGPVVFDIETSGFGEEAIITVAGFAHSLGESLVLTVDGRDYPDKTELVTQLDQDSTGSVRLEIVEDEQALLQGAES
jgi:uncharacterized protein YprB with RNaseH-like and TPR domain